MTTHTRSPWRVEEDRQGRRPYIAIIIEGSAIPVSIGSRNLTFLPHSHGSHRGETRRYRDFTDEDRANARLIAAGPELLATLKAYVANDVDSNDEPLWQQAVAAIAKAEGAQ